MKKTDEELHYDSMLRFVALANELAKEGVPKKVVSAGLMTASTVYATYAAVGNKGTLNESRVNKIAESYKKQLEHTQKIRQERQQEKAEQKIDDTVEQIVSFPDED